MPGIKLPTLHATVKVAYAVLWPLTASLEGSTMKSWYWHLVLKKWVLGAAREHQQLQTVTQLEWQLHEGPSGASTALSVACGI